LRIVPFVPPVPATEVANPTRSECPLNFIRGGTRVPHTPVQDQCHIAIAETSLFDHSVLAHFAEERMLRPSRIDLTQLAQLEK
jgi:hypothetical protein